MTNTTAYFGFACIAVLAIIIFRFADIKETEILKCRKTEIISVLLLTVISVTILIIGTVCRLKSYESSCFDMGIFLQMFEYMSKTGKQYTTVERNVLMSHFNVHFSPCWYLLLPIYMIFRNSVVLVILQVLIIASGVLPLIKICRLYKLGRTDTVLCSIIYLFYPAFCSSQFFDIHENMFLPAFILWLYYFMCKKNHIGEVAACLLILSVKEDAGVYIICLGLYSLFSKKKKTSGLLITIIGILGFIGTNLYINIFGEGVKVNRYDIYLAENDSGLIAVILNVIKNPAYFVSNLITVDKLLFLLLMTVPFIFVCFKINKASDLFLLVPLIIVNLSTDYTYQYNVDYQYVFGSGAMLFCAFVKEVSILKQKRKVLLISAMSAVILFSVTVSDKIQLYTERYENTALITQTNEFIDTIDKTVCIYADTYIIPSLYKFDNVYLLDNADVSKAEIILLDNRKNDYQGKLEKYKKTFSICEVHGMVTVLLNY
ncbi:DUF2079 domain-containing protein [Ruminococcus bicirculans (ex Wegman et al. 2014)]|nr:DUF2079 domain-containing protein [Ruminococcus bicirculans (ex Wegman et al. 2014)]